MIRVSVVIPVKNGAATIKACLEALLAQTIAKSIEIIAIDSGSTDGTTDIIRQYPVELVHIVLIGVGLFFVLKRELFQYYLNHPSAIHSYLDNPQYIEQVNIEAAYQKPVKIVMLGILTPIKCTGMNY
jgi:cellulose synthase/poly-beta-1,6-N-acetylglucosamine synthase-like glycosyltransferase